MNRITQNHLSKSWYRKFAQSKRQLIAVGVVVTVATIFSISPSGYSRAQNSTTDTPGCAQRCDETCASDPSQLCHSSFDPVSSIVVNKATVPVFDVNTVHDSCPGEPSQTCYFQHDPPPHFRSGDVSCSSESSQTCYNPTDPLPQPDEDIVPSACSETVDCGPCQNDPAQTCYNQHDPLPPDEETVGGGDGEPCQNDPSQTCYNQYDPVAPRFY